MDPSYNHLKAHRQTCLCSVKCHWRFTKTPYNSREPTLQPFNALTFQRSNDSRFTLQRFNASTLQRFNASTNLMELNHILLFTAIATSALVVLQAFQPQSPGARARAAVVLIASVLAWLLARPIAGWLSAIVWCALLVVPAFLQNRAWAARYQYRPSDSNRGSAISLSPVVLALIIVNVAVFILELLAGGSTNPMTLHRLGELDTSSVIFRHQYWRLLAALFLHYGPIHIFFNLFALLLLGPALERQIGGFLFAVCYLVSGIGSSIAVVLLTKLRLLEPVQLVGASGCIMGVVGTWTGFLLRHRHAPLARQRLRNIFVIVLLQLVFDLVTPRVSMSAHLGGLFTGFLLGLLVPAKPGPSTPRSRF